VKREKEKEKGGVIKRTNANGKKAKIMANLFSLSRNVPEIGDKGVKIFGD
jgi:hypothetical protein